MKKVVIIFALIIICLLFYETNDKSVVIPDTAIRLRIIPNSNSLIDQKMKSKVKDYLEDNMYSLIGNKSSKEEAKNVIIQNIPTIKSNIDKIFLDNNYDMNYTINYGNNYFPSKEYRGIEYNPGYYESLVISIGAADGDNWWCVLFPNLCLADLSEKSDNEYKLWIIEQINKYF